MYEGEGEGGQRGHVRVHVEARDHVWAGSHMRARGVAIRVHVC